MKKITTILLIVLAVVIMGSCSMSYDTSATADDIQGTWNLDEVTGILCCPGMITYEFEGDIYGDVSATTLGTTAVYFEYTFDDSEGIISIDGATSSNGGLVDDDYYVYIDGDKMAWTMDEYPSQTAYIFSKID